jgi:hypothetical protein
VPVPSFLDGRLTFQSPCPTARGLKHQAKFIEKNEC